MKACAAQLNGFPIATAESKNKVWKSWCAAAAVVPKEQAAVVMFAKTNIFRNTANNTGPANCRKREMERKFRGQINGWGQRPDLTKAKMR